MCGKDCALKNLPSHLPVCLLNSLCMRLAPLLFCVMLTCVQCWPYNYVATPDEPLYRPTDFNEILNDCCWINSLKSASFISLYKYFETMTSVTYFSGVKYLRYHYGNFNNIFLGNHNL